MKNEFKNKVIIELDRYNELLDIEKVYEGVSAQFHVYDRWDGGYKCTIMPKNEAIKKIVRSCNGIQGDYQELKNRIQILKWATVREFKRWRKQK